MLYQSFIQRKFIEKSNLSNISPPLTNQHVITLFSQFAVKKKWNTALIGQSGPISFTITLSSLVRSEKSEKLLYADWPKWSTELLLQKESSK